MISSFKDRFLEFLEEDNTAGGLSSVFGPGNQGTNSIYNPNEGRFTSNDSIYAPGDARVPKFLGLFRRGGVGKPGKKRSKRKYKSGKRRRK